MDKKKESFFSERIWIWMHNEFEAQNSTEENQQDIPKEQKRKQR